MEAIEAELSPTKHSALLVENAKDRETHEAEDIQGSWKTKEAPRVIER